MTTPTTAFPETEVATTGAATGRPRAGDAGTPVPPFAGPLPAATSERAFVRSSGWALGARVCMAATRGVGLVLLSRALGAAAFGEYSLILATFAVGSGVGTFGLDQAHVYFTGLRRQDAARMLTNVLWLAAVAGSLVALGLLGAVHVLRERIFDGAPRDAIVATALALPAILHHNYVTGMIVGRSWFRYYGTVEIAKWCLHLGILAMLAAGDRLTVRGALLALYIPIALTGIVHHVVLQRAERAPFAALFRGPHFGLMRESLSYGARACLLTVGQVLHLRLDVYLVKYFTSATTVGHYALATNIADVILYAGRSVGLVLFARSAGDPRPTANLAPRVTRMMAVVVCGMAAVVALGRELWIGTLFGPAYLACSAAIACRLPGIVAESVSLVLVGDFLGRARALLVMAPTGIAVAVGFLLNAWWVPIGGIAAAASAFSLASILRAAGLVWLHRRISGIPWYRYWLPTLGELRDIARRSRRRRS